MLTCPVHEMGSYAGDFKTPAQNCSVHETGHLECRAIAHFTNWATVLPSSRTRTISQTGRNNDTVVVVMMTLFDLSHSSIIT